MKTTLMTTQTRTKTTTTTSALKPLLGCKLNCRRVRWYIKTTTIIAVLTINTKKMGTTTMGTMEIDKQVTNGDERITMAVAAMMTIITA